MTDQPMQPIADPGFADLTIDQADRLRDATMHYVSVLEGMGLRSTIMVHQLTEGAAVDAFPNGTLWTATRHRTWDHRVEDRHTVHLWIPPAESAS